MDFDTSNMGQYLTPSQQRQLGMNGAGAGADDGTIPEFYTHEVYDQTASERSGRPVFRDIPFVRVRFVGDRSRTIERKVTENDKQRWPRQWAAYEAGMAAIESGTPLSQWPLIARSQVDEFKMHNIHTVEQLAGLPDVFLQRFMGGQAMREQARTYLKNAEDGSALSALVAEVRTLKAQNEALEKQLADIAAKGGKSMDDAVANAEVHELKMQMQQMMQMMAQQNAPKTRRKASDEEQA